MGTPPIALSTQQNYSIQCDSNPSFTDATVTFTIGDSFRGKIVNWKNAFLNLRSTLTAATTATSSTIGALGAPVMFAPKSGQPFVDTFTLTAGGKVFHNAQSDLSVWRNFVI